MARLRVMLVWKAIKKISQLKLRNFYKKLKFYIIYNINLTKTFFSTKMDASQILRILSDYLKTGTQPPSELSRHIVSQLENTNPKLHAVHRLLAKELAALPYQPCPNQRDCYMQGVLARLCQEMSTVAHPSVEQMFPILKKKLEILGTNIKNHNEIAIVMFREFLGFLSAFINGRSFSTADSLQLARGNCELFALRLRPMVKLIIDTISAAAVQPCVVERLQFSIDAVRQMIALMSDIVHPVIGTILPHYERFIRCKREEVRICNENLTNLLRNAGNLYEFYVEGRPFDTSFPLRVNTYLSSDSCPVSHHPLIKAVLGTLQQGPSCLQAITCRERRHDHVLQTVNELTTIAQNMPRQVPSAIQALEEIVTSLNEQRQSRNLQLFMTNMLMIRILQNVAD